MMTCTSLFFTNFFFLTFRAMGAITCERMEQDELNEVKMSE